MTSEWGAAALRARQQAQREERRLRAERAAAVDAADQPDALAALRHAWQAGVDGDRATAQGLSALTDVGWVVLPALPWPGRAHQGLDHVAVGPGGVVVLDSRTRGGAARVSDGVLHQGGVPHPHADEDAGRMAAAVAAVLDPPERALVRAALCLVRQPLAPVRTDAGVVVVGLEQLPGWLRSLPRVLDAPAVADLADRVRAGLSAAPAPAHPRAPRPAPAPPVVPLAPTAVLPAPAPEPVPRGPEVRRPARPAARAGAPVRPRTGRRGSAAPAPLVVPHHQPGRTMLVLQAHPVGRAHRRRRLPRPVAAGLVVLALLAVGAGWYGGVTLLSGEDGPLPLVVTDAPPSGELLPGEVPPGEVPDDAVPDDGVPDDGVLDDGPPAGAGGSGEDGPGGAAPVVPVLGP